MVEITRPQTYCASILAMMLGIDVQAARAIKLAAMNGEDWRALLPEKDGE